MIWASRQFAIGLWGQAQDDFESLHARGRHMEEMMLICVGDDGLQTETVFACVPGLTWLAMMLGFAQITEDKLPQRASLLVGNPKAFRRRFDYDVARDDHPVMNYARQLRALLPDYSGFGSIRARPPEPHMCSFSNWPPATPSVPAGKAVETYRG